MASASHYIYIIRRILLAATQFMMIHYLKLENPILVASRRLGSRIIRSNIPGFHSLKCYHSVVHCVYFVEEIKEYL